PPRAAMRSTAEFSCVYTHSLHCAPAPATSSARGGIVRGGPMRMLCVSLVAAAALAGNPVPAFAQTEFLAALSGANEVPGVNSPGFGSATLDVNVSGNVLGISFELIGVNLTDAFQGHIHCGDAGVNGPVVVWLAGTPAAPATAGWDLNGTWVRAKVKESSI